MPSASQASTRNPARLAAQGDYATELTIWLNLAWSFSHFVIVRSLKTENSKLTELNVCYCICSLFDCFYLRYSIRQNLLQLSVSRNDA